MPPQIHTLPQPPDAAVCTAILTYIVVVFFLVRLSIDELGPEARRRGRLPPSSVLYLANMLFWPVTTGVLAGLLILGLMTSILAVACSLSARVFEACRRWTHSCFLNRRRVDDLEMVSLVPCHLEGVSVDDAGSDHGCSQAEAAFREVVAALRKECGLTPDEWGRVPCSRSLAPLR